MTQEQKVRQIFSRLYNLFRSKSGSKDRFESHPGFDQRSGKENKNPWNRLVEAAQKFKIDLPGYIFVTLRKIMEENGAREVHPHFLLNETLLTEYQKTQSSVFRGIEIQWQDQQLLFDAGMKECAALLPPGTSEEERAMYVLLAGTAGATSFRPLYIFYRAALYDCSQLQEELKEAAQFEYTLFPSVYTGLLKNEKVLKRLKE
jgi:hypothetical protein